MSRRIDSNAADPMALEDQATAALVAATSRLSIAHRDRAKRLHAVLVDIHTLASLNANEAECRAYEIAVGAVVDTLFGGKAATCEHTARRLELEADTQEDHTQGVLSIEGETATMLEQHADSLEKQARTSRTLAFLQRNKARVIRTTRGVARQRFGLRGGAA